MSMKGSSSHSVEKIGQTLSPDVESLFNSTDELFVAATKKLFPYHVVVDGNFIVKSVGTYLPRVLGCFEVDLLGQRIDNVLTIIEPGSAHWDWSWIQQHGDDSFLTEPSAGTIVLADLRFKVDLVHVSECVSGAMFFNMAPDANDTVDLLTMGINVDDLPRHGAYREAMELRERLAFQERNRLELVELRRELETEKALVESLVPQHVAVGLRNGDVIEPRQHENCTFFFSDVVGFLTICQQASPLEVTEMLNSLYRVMDYLADKFNLFKIETTGDSYLCASGLPNDDPMHAERVSNFAIAVNQCAARFIRSPSNRSIQLRIGIHSGPAASGVVGATSPRYRVFGDSINVTARHTSSGEAGKIHCSSTTQQALHASGADANFVFEDRGIVEMKGKGGLRTFWIQSSAINENFDQDGVAQLQGEIQDVLERAKTAMKPGDGELKDVPSPPVETKNLLEPILEKVRYDLTLKKLQTGSASSRSLLTGSSHSRCAPTRVSRQRSTQLLDASSHHSGRRKEREETHRLEAFDFCDNN